MNAVEILYLECERARAQGDLIKKVSANDKEFHFQNWVQERLTALKMNFDDPGRNSYPDFRLVNDPQGFEVKGLAWPGREADYDSNSQVPTGLHNGREIFYIFGRYPADVSGHSDYPVTDLVVCHGSFLNADIEYVHENKSFRGFGSYGDILVRDRKMYVVPTPYALIEGTVGLSTLILPAATKVDLSIFNQVGVLTRTEVEKIVIAYEFNLQTNELKTHLATNPSAGKKHVFVAYRSKKYDPGKTVALSDKANRFLESN
jgi:hypothetical protein